MGGVASEPPIAGTISQWLALRAPEASTGRRGEGRKPMPWDESSPHPAAAPSCVTRGVPRSQASLPAPNAAQPPPLPGGNGVCRATPNAPSPSASIRGCGGHAASESCAPREEHGTGKPATNGSAAAAGPRPRCLPKVHTQTGVRAHPGTCVPPHGLCSCGAVARARVLVSTCTHSCATRRQCGRVSPHARARARACECVRAKWVGGTPPCAHTLAPPRS